jgi:hypothetical protein
MNRQNFHAWKQGDRFNPFSKLARNFWLYRFVPLKALMISLALFEGGALKISSSISISRFLILILLEIF